MIAQHQEQFRAGITEQNHHHKTGQPGRIAFPFEAGHILREPRGGDEVFPDVVLTAAVHLQFLAVNACVMVAWMLQPEFPGDDIIEAPVQPVAVIPCNQRAAGSAYSRMKAYPIIAQLPR